MRVLRSATGPTLLLRLLQLVCLQWMAASPCSNLPGLISPDIYISPHSSVGRAFWHQCHKLWFYRPARVCLEASDQDASFESWSRPASIFNDLWMLKALVLENLLNLHPTKRVELLLALWQFWLEWALSWSPDNNTGRCTMRCDEYKLLWLLLPLTVLACVAAVSSAEVWSGRTCCQIPISRQCQNACQRVSNNLWSRKQKTKSNFGKT